MNSYCLERTRNRLWSLWLAVLLLFMGLAVSVYGFTEFRADKSAWDYMEYIKFAVGCIGGLLLLASGFATAYTALRDGLCPEKSALAKSIRSQLPYPDAEIRVGELFAMVDEDIRANGQWFDRVAVGKEWILGDAVSYIPRIRVFFGRDEIRSRRSGERMNTTRILELHILDDRRNHQITTLNDPNELQMLLDCISLRAPDALRRPYSEWAAWCQKSDAEWENMLREYRLQQGKREMEAFQNSGAEYMANQNMVLTCPDGSVTSRVTPEKIREILLECLERGEGSFSLSPGRPVEQNGIRFAELECFAAFYEDLKHPSVHELENMGEAELMLKMTSAGAAGERPQYGRVCHTDIRTAQRILLEWFHGAVPDCENWESVSLFVKREQQKKSQSFPPHLGLMSPLGVFQSHDRFTVEDVEAASEGLKDGSYQMIDLTLPGGYLWMHIQGGDKTDGRCKVSVTRADPDKLRYFRNVCTHRQAAQWLMEFAKGRFRPDWTQWRDYTRQAEKERKRK